MGWRGEICVCVIPSVLTVLTAYRSFIKLLNMYLLCHRPTVDFVFMRVVLNSAAGHHKLALLRVCQTLSLHHFNILSLSWSSFYSCLLLYFSLSLVRGCNFIYHLLCPVANIGSKSTLARNHTIWYRFASTQSSISVFVRARITPSIYISQHAA